VTRRRTVDVPDDPGERDQVAVVVARLAEVLGDGKGVFSTRETPSAALSTGQVAVGAAQPAIVAPADNTRRSILIENTGAATVYLGSRDVTATSGKRLGPGAAVTITTRAPVYAITAAAAGSVDFLAETGTHR
jgi:hypothetical protein